MRAFLKFQNVTFLYDSAAEPLFETISFQAGSGWMGVIGANGTGKTTLLKLAAGLLTPVAGNIIKPARTVYCAQRTDDRPDLFTEFATAQTGHANSLKGLLGIEEDWQDRWQTLSHGERKKAQIATALWQQPDLLAVDEPTNHVDLYARQLIAEALRRYTQAGLIVSHDRMLLDGICTQCLFVESPRIVIRPGGITQASAEAEKERSAVLKQKEVRKKAYKKLDREFKRRKEKAGLSKKLVSKKGLAPKDHDAREKRDRAIVSGKDASDSRKQRQLRGRLDQAAHVYHDLHVQKESPLGIWFEGSLSKRDCLLDLPAGHLSLGKDKRLEYSELLIQPSDRIALVGPNGSGKSTLMQKIVRSLRVDAEDILYMPQEIDISESRKLIERVRRLSSSQLGELMAFISHLGSRPDRLLTTELPSPGEVRKLFLALGILHHPHIILMDEPTNHMDMPSIECLEKALVDCPCGLLLVSHDMLFLRHLTNKMWEIQPDNTQNTYVLKERLSRLQ